MITGAGAAALSLHHSPLLSSPHLSPRPHQHQQEQQEELERIVICYVYVHLGAPGKNVALADNVLIINIQLLRQSFIRKFLRNSPGFDVSKHSSFLIIHYYLL